MRRYEDPVEVRKGKMAGVEAPEQFLWRGRLWKVRAVLAHWVETGPWWQSSGVDADTGCRPLGDLLPRELWRVEAGRGAQAGTDGTDGTDGGGVFDLAFDWSDGRWQLVGCVD